MTALLVCALVASFLLARPVVDLLANVEAARWPARDPEPVEDDKSHDHRLAQLARLLGSMNLSEAHHAVVALVERIDPDGRTFDARVTTFLTHPPLDKPVRYRRELDHVLTTLELM